MLSWYPGIHAKMIIQNYLIISPLFFFLLNYSFLPWIPWIPNCKEKVTSGIQVSIYAKMIIQKLPNTSQLYILFTLGTLYYTMDTIQLRVRSGVGLYRGGADDWWFNPPRDREPLLHRNALTLSLPLPPLRCMHMH